MKDILKRLLEISKSGEFSKVNMISGNKDLASVILSYPKYLSQRKSFCAEPSQGRPSALGDDGKFLVHIVKELYEVNAEDYTTERTLNDSLRGALVGRSDRTGRAFVCRYFFDTHDKNIDKKHHWIDTLSALNYACDFFGGLNASFGTFLGEYNKVYLKMDNRKMVSFYPRSLSDLCAVYTIYTCRTCTFYRDMKARLTKAREEGIRLLKENKASGISVKTNTDTIRKHLVLHVFESFGRDTEAVIEKLCNFIRSNPTQFDVERHYYAIRELLNKKIIPSGLFTFENRDMLDKFCSDEYDIVYKDKLIRKFEYEVFQSVYNCHGFSCDDESELFKLIVDNDDGAAIDHNTREIFNKSYNSKTEIAAASSVLSMLRHMAILLTVKKTIDTNKRAWEKWEIVSKQNLMDAINRDFLSELGLMNLMAADKDYCTDTNRADWCISRFIDIHYEELEKKYRLKKN